MTISPVLMFLLQSIIAVSIYLWHGTMTPTASRHASSISSSTCGICKRNGSHAGGRICWTFRC